MNYLPEEYYALYANKRQQATLLLCYNLYNYIFSFGDGVEVLEPKEIRRQIKEMINKMAEKYIT